ncbi:hypothetical protein [Streptomyces sp. MP131-18]|uniref:hypothetical protein n=1 Tax=Streptomyces sp. MP131-18 TaxID=1857892 RepID=UPI00097C0FD1|nr:hypothetical protein [Streptomyces sp. MP131-18]ONK13075.1 hypothetical protein STBA_38370 [Streptomyces sp. MP131-18]
MDETYLGDLCRHLTEHHPRHGHWTVRALRWPREHGDRQGVFLRVANDPLQLYGAATEADLPLPPDTEVQQQAVYDTTLAAVLAASALLKPHAPNGLAHHVDGPDIGQVLGAARQLSDVSLEITLKELVARSRHSLTRLLLSLEQARNTHVDLRTVAAVAYAISTRGDGSLSTNPTGHWTALTSTTDSRWYPVSYVVRSAWRTRHAHAPAANVGQENDETHVSVA